MVNLLGARKRSTKILITAADKVNSEEAVVTPTDEVVSRAGEDETVLILHASRWQ